MASQTKKAPRHYGAVWYDPEQECEMPEGYSLDEEQRKCIRQAMRGIPVTYDHKGTIRAVTQAVADRRTTKRPIATRLRDGPPIEHPIGHVADAFKDAQGKEWVTFAIKPGHHRTNEAITAGDLKAVSLTSCGSSPIELAVTPDPARPKSDILFAAGSLKRATDYKLDLIEGNHTAASILIMASKTAAMDTSKTETPAEPFSFEKALAAMDPATRAAFEKRYTAIAEKLAAAEKSDKEKEAAIEEFKKVQAEYNAAASADKAILKDTLDRFKAVTDPKHQSAYGVGDQCFKQVMEAENPEVLRRNIERIITVANRSMAAAAAAPERDEAPTKRFKAAAEPVVDAAAPITAVAAAAAAPAQDDLAGMTPLERAFAENFA